MSSKIKPEKIEWINDRFIIPPQIRDQLKRIYPNFDYELNKMEAWYMANPQKRKKQIHRFMVNWLNRVNQTQQIYSKDYSICNSQIPKYEEEDIAPPPSAWNELKERLKRA